jgi:hypothetical protein
LPRHLEWCTKQESGLMNGLTLAAIGSSKPMKERFEYFFTPEVFG